MRKCIAVLVALMVIGSLAFAAPAKSKSDALTPLVGPGDFVVNAGVGWGGISGGVELSFFQVDIAKVIPLTFGAAARASIDPGIFYGYTAFGVGGFGTIHIGFKDLNLPENLHWLSNVDSYAGLGFGFASMDIWGTGLGFSTFEGVSYYLNDKLALGFEYGYLGRSADYYGYSVYYSTFNVTFKL
jgi:hypothetical protein